MREDERPVEIPIQISLNDIARLGQVVDQLRSGYGHADRSSDHPSPQDPSAEGLHPVKVARLLLLQRQQLGLTFADLEFAEPAWDVLLHLYAGQHEQHRVAVYALAAAVGGSRSTAIRRITAMEEGGQLIRLRDGADRRRSFVELAPALRDRLDEHLRDFGRELEAVFGGISRSSMVHTANHADGPVGPP